MRVGAAGDVDGRGPPNRPPPAAPPASKKNEYTEIDDAHDALTNARHGQPPPRPRAATAAVRVVKQGLDPAQARTTDAARAFNDFNASVSQRVLTGWFKKDVQEGKMGKPRRRFFVMRGNAVRYFVSSQLVILWGRNDRLGGAVRTATMTARSVLPRVRDFE